MADGEPDVKDIERVEIAPTMDDELVDGGETQPASSPTNDGATDGEPEESEQDPEEKSPDGKPEALVNRKPATVPAPEAGETVDGLTRIAGETPREYALRLELTNVRSKLRKERTDELLPTRSAPSQARKELTDEDKQTLGKYKPEELAAIREVLPALAKELGFARIEELEGASYQDKAQGELDGFLEKHPEYLPDKDSDGTLWGALKAEFGLYKPPQNPKDYRKILERAHQTVFGIKPGGALPNNTAASKRIEVASHGGAAGPGSSGAGAGRRAVTGAAQGYRFDMLKGFSDEDKAALEDKAGA